MKVISDEREVFPNIYFYLWLPPEFFWSDGSFGAINLELFGLCAYIIPLFGLMYTFGVHKIDLQTLLWI